VLGSLGDFSDWIVLRGTRYHNHSVAQEIRDALATYTKKWLKAVVDNDWKPSDIGARRRIWTQLASTMDVSQSAVSAFFAHRIELALVELDEWAAHE
jgi:hypothetical protein